jgi:hypothetical protein
MAEPQITEQIVREAPEIEAIKLALLQDAQTLADQPITFGPDGMISDYSVADFTDLQTKALDDAEAGIGTYGQYITDAGNLLTSAETPLSNIVGEMTTKPGDFVSTGITTGTDLMTKGSGAITGDMITGYMNPYQAAIQAEIDRSYDLAARKAEADAASAGAFGGTRAYLQQQEINRNRTSALAQSQAQAFLNAQQMAADERKRQLVAGEGIGSLGVQGGQTLGSLALSQGQALSDLGIRTAGLGEAAQAMDQRDISFAFDLGEKDRQLDQMVLDAERKSQIEQAYEPYQRIGFLSDIYKGAPSTQMSLTGASVPTASPFQQLVGGLTAVGGTAAAANKAGLFG